MRTSSAQSHAQLVKQEDRAQRLARLKDAAAAIAARGDGRSSSTFRVQHCLLPFLLVLRTSHRCSN